ncbi:MAG: glycoside hydrolase family 97 N-terminal domain-containing protein, partial [Lentisphaeria bacterium]|nr:glycoside hydrolase family 97 N-terminal domain-containing protein [Lentisphaeria bacterium]
MKFSLSMKAALSCAAVFLAAGLCSAADPFLTSPDADKTIRVYLDEGNVLRVERNATEVFQVRLGLKSNKANYDFSQLKLKGQVPSGSSVVLVSEKYTAVNGKRSERNFQMNEKTLVFGEGENQIGVIVRAGSDSFAFRYNIGGSDDVEFQGETTSFVFPLTDGFRMQRRVTSYEDRYIAYTADELKPQQQGGPGQGGPRGQGGPGGRGGRGGGNSNPVRNWNYPLLFNSADKSTWGLLSETWFDGTYCGTYLVSDFTDNGVTFTTHYPDQGEGAGQGAVNPTT